MELRNFVFSAQDLISGSPNQGRGIRVIIIKTFHHGGWGKRKLYRNLVGLDEILGCTDQRDKSKSKRVSKRDKLPKAARCRKRRTDTLNSVTQTKVSLKSHKD